jgi:hypothetical protein
MLPRPHRAAADSSRAQLRLLVRKVACRFVDSPSSSGSVPLPALRAYLRDVRSLAVPAINAVDRIRPAQGAWVFRGAKVQVRACRPRLLPASRLDALVLPRGVQGSGTPRVPKKDP